MQGWLRSYLKCSSSSYNKAIQERVAHCSEAIPDGILYLQHIHTLYQAPELSLLGITLQAENCLQSRLQTQETSGISGLDILGLVLQKYGSM